MQLGENSSVMTNLDSADGQAGLFWSATGPVEITFNIDGAFQQLGYSGHAIADVTYTDPNTGEMVTTSYAVGGASTTTISVITGVPEGSLTSWGEVKISIRDVDTSPGSTFGSGVLYNFMKFVDRALGSADGLSRSAVYNVQYM